MPRPVRTPSRASNSYWLLNVEMYSLLNEMIDARTTESRASTLWTTVCISFTWADRVIDALPFWLAEIETGPASASRNSERASPVSLIYGNLSQTRLMQRAPR